MKSSFRLVFCGILLLAINSCTNTDVEGLQSIDQLVLELAPPNVQQNQFTFRVTTTRSYGCDSFLTGRLVRGKAFLSMEVFGVVRGRHGCSTQSAGPLIETVRMGNQRTFDLELRYDKKTDRYRITVTGETWTVQKTRNELQSRLVLL